MKKYHIMRLILSFTFFLTISINTFSQVINFNKVYKIDDIRSESKFIFIDFYADWCEPCKRMEKEVFSDTVISKYFNQNYSNYKINIDSDIGKILKEKYSVDGLPTSLYLDKSGQEIGRQVGYKNKESFYSFGTNTIPILGKKPKNLSSKDSLYNYILEMDTKKVTNKEIVNKFFDLLEDENYEEDKILDLLFQKISILDFERKGYKYVFENIEILEKDTLRITHFTKPQELNVYNKNKNLLYYFYNSLSIPINKALSKAIKDKNSELFDISIEAYLTLIQRKDTLENKKMPRNICRDILVFYTRILPDSIKCKSAINDLYDTIVKNKKSDDIIATSIKAYHEAKDKILKTEPNYEFDKQTEEILKSYLTDYVEHLKLLQESIIKFNLDIKDVDQIDVLKNKLISSKIIY